MIRLPYSGRLRLSISWRLTVWYGLTVLVLLSLLAIFSYTNFHLGRHDVFNQHLSHEIRELSPFIRLEGDEPEFVDLDQLRSVAFRTHGLHSTYVRLLSTAGERLFQSPNFDARGPLEVVLPSGEGMVTLAREWDGYPIGTTYKPLFSKNGILEGWLEVTGFEWSLHEQLRRLGRGLVAGIALSVLLAIIAGFVLARRVLRPVVILTAAANQIQTSRLGARLPLHSGVQDELTDLAETFNAMLNRIEDSFERERRFSDNAAHELLTPLSNLANATEIALRRTRSSESYRETLRQQLVDIEEMTHTVRSLLQLSRTAQLKDLPKESVDLAALTRDRVDRFRRLANSKDLDLQFSANEGITIRAGAQQMREMVDNLLDNAIKYTPVGGTISVELSTHGAQAKLCVTDDGIGFTENRADDLFDRFYRGNSSLVQAQPGSGLGLAIVKTIVVAFGGDVSARSGGVGAGSTFEVRLPLESSLA